ncbi:hypothetical protein K7X08_000924 [Anisodus acutangulus]|uniref:Uncharacterized protein n=1 Tax=Anisodus acutangulus TaxID=402998 RepID=A0A9Q1MMR4_9SOLA|nr:hypothetical protein K7X08_000924 [Anisodus acutangulus]
MQAGKQFTNVYKGKQTVRVHANPNSFHNGVIKILNSGKVLGNVQDVHQWQTQKGKKGEGVGGSGSHEEVVDVVEDSEGELVPNEANDAALQIVATAIPVAEKVVEKKLNVNAKRTLWSDQLEENGEDGEIACDKIDDQEQSEDSITSSQEINAMFDKVEEENEDSTIFHATADATEGFRSYYNADADATGTEHEHTNPMVRLDDAIMQKQVHISNEMQSCSEEVDKTTRNVHLQRMLHTGELTPIGAKKQGKPPDISQPMVWNQSSAKKQKGTPSANVSTQQQRRLRC